MTTKLRTWGNSRAVRIPAKAIRLSGLTEDDDLDVYAENGEIILFNGSAKEALARRVMAYREGFSSLSDITVDSDVREEAEEVCEEIGLPLRAAIGVFLHKICKERRIPFELSAADEINGRGISGEEVDYSPLYPKEFFEFFGSGNGLGFDEEPEDPIEDIYAIKRESMV